jgi:SNF2 family DNA or RNA helicase
MFNLSHTNIRNETDTNSFRRGLQYFEQGLVKALDVEQVDVDMVVLMARVQGNSAIPYTLEVDIEKSAGNTVIINGQCSCPVRHNCKHVVAACLEYAANANKTKVDSSLFWLDNFIDASSPQKPINPHAIESIFYLLKHSNNVNEIEVDLVVCRHLKKGGLGKSKRTDLYRIVNQYIRASYVTDADVEIAKLLEAQSNSMWAGTKSYPMNGELGYLCLSKILETSRCMYKSADQPVIQKGASRALDLNWHKEKNGDCRLNVNVEPAALVLNTVPALYFDIEHHEIGALSNADFNSQQWDMLLSVPTVHADNCEVFSQQLITQLPNISIPPPVEIETLNIANEKPMPCLELITDINPLSDERTHLMRLRFAYADFKINVLPISSVINWLENAHVISVQRDIDLEEEFMERIFEENFQGVILNMEDNSIELNDTEQADFGFASPNNLTPMQKLEQWRLFIENTIPELKQEGWKITFNPNFKLQFHQVSNWEDELEASIDDNSIKDNNDWFELRFDLDVKGKKIPLLPLVANVLKHYDPGDLPKLLTLPLPAYMGEGQYIQIPAERIQGICEILFELYDQQTLSAQNFNAENGGIQLSRFDAPRLAELEEHNEATWRGGKAMRDLGRKLKNFKGIKKVAPPRGLKTTLRDYQQQGLNWLQFLRSYQFNGILADDMGLGKTVQTLAHLLKEKEARRLNKPCLIVAPTSLMSNWRREAEQFTPKLSVLILQGTDRKNRFDELENYDLVLTTFPLIVRDRETLLAHDYYYLILDEAQVIKNPNAKAAKLVREIKAEHRLCITGTPMENHLGELWALFDFLMPGFLGNSKTFTQQFRNPIEKHANDEVRGRLAHRINPFMLRRSKGEVAEELPDKTEIIRSVSFDKKQAALYESIRLSMQKKVREAIKDKGLSRSHITILDALLKLRQTCCDPQLMSLPQAKKVKSSAKLEMLMEMLPEMIDEGRKILIFSQFTKMLGIIEKQLIENKISYSKLTGQTTKREQAIDKFRSGNAEVFLISLKAGGVGLNLTEADTVIHYDPWWNPAVENQATDRAHRIGQNKAVFVYKLIIENTLEEKIMAMQARKKSLADGVYDKDKSSKDMKLTADDLQELFAPLVVDL